jgi:hypothetical protein
MGKEVSQRGTTLKEVSVLRAVQVWDQPLRVSASLNIVLQGPCWPHPNKTKWLLSWNLCSNSLHRQQTNE